jgi:hypothetical protein
VKFYTLEEISNELHISPGTARNRLAMGKDMPPSIRVGRRRLFPISEFEKWVTQIIAPIQEELHAVASDHHKKRGRPRNPEESGSLA